MRLFIAIDFSRQKKEEIGNSLHFLTLQFPQISWIKTDDLHLTLKFLGNIGNQITSGQADQLIKIKRGIKRSVGGIKPFELNFDSLGFFHKEQLIVWLGVKKSPNLLYLVNNIEQEMQKLGWKKEKRPYSPHVTIGRGKKITKDTAQRIKKVILSSPQISPSPFLVSEITFMQSKLTSLGPIYSPLKNFALL